MNAKLNNLLIEKYPVLFRQMKYLNIGDGWFHLMDELCEAIEKWNTKGKDPVVFNKIDQFGGGLRVRVNREYDDSIYVLLNHYNLISKSVCEFCGKAHPEAIVKRIEHKHLAICDQCYETGRKIDEIREKGRRAGGSK